MKKLVIITLLIFGFSGTANAQFFEKLANRIEKAAERTIVRKSEQKTTRETGKVFDKTFNKNKKKKKRKRKKSPTKRRQNEQQVDNKRQEGNDIDNKTSMPSVFGFSSADPAASYTFSYKAEMQIESGKDVMYVDYHIPESGSYLGTKYKDLRIKGKFFSVFDIQKNAVFSFIEDNGQKTQMGMAFNIKDTNENPNISIKATGKTKNILGYNCQEYIMTSEEINASVWVTKEVSIRFPNSLYKVKQNKGNNQEWLKNIDGWAMEMVMTDTSKRKENTIKIKCLSIGKSDLTIQTSDYSKPGY